MHCLGFALTLKPGAYDGYKRAHDEIWPDLAKGMHENGVSMAIYRDGDRLYVFACATSEEHWDQSREDPLLAKWNNYMTEFLETDENGRIALTILAPAFSFGDFKRAEL